MNESDFIWLFNEEKTAEKFKNVYILVFADTACWVSI